jgi:hypothetical protein
MQPENYLLLLAGAGAGAAIGFAIATAITALRIRRAHLESWAAAERFYARRFAEMLKQ